MQLQLLRQSAKLTGPQIYSTSDITDKGLTVIVRRDGTTIVRQDASALILILSDFKKISPLLWYIYCFYSLLIKWIYCDPCMHHCIDRKLSTGG